MAVLPSRRDSRRTKGDYMRLCAERAVTVDGKTLEQFVGQFKPGYRDLARRAFETARAKYQ